MSLLFFQSKNIITKPITKPTQKYTSTKRNHRKKFVPQKKGALRKMALPRTYFTKEKLESHALKCMLDLHLVLS